MFKIEVVNLWDGDPYISLHDPEKRRNYIYTLSADSNTYKDVEKFVADTEKSFAGKSFRDVKSFLDKEAVFLSNYTFEESKMPSLQKKLNEGGRADIMKFAVYFMEDGSFSFEAPNEDRMVLQEVGSKPIVSVELITKGTVDPYLSAESSDGTVYMYIADQRDPKYNTIEKLYDAALGFLKHGGKFRIYQFLYNHAIYIGKEKSYDDHIEDIAADHDGYDFETNTKEW